MVGCGICCEEVCTIRTKVMLQTDRAVVLYDTMLYSHAGNAPRKEEIKQIWEGDCMFRPLRRKKNALPIEQAKELLHCARRGVLAVNGDEGYPYAIPLNYLYEEEGQKIFFHSAKAGYKVDALNASDKVCFTVYGNEIIREEEWAPYVQSCVVFGRCHAIEDEEMLKTALTQFARKYYPNEEMVTESVEKDWRAVSMFQIEIEHICGKEIQEK